MSDLRSKLLQSQSDNYQDVTLSDQSVVRVYAPAPTSQIRFVTNNREHLQAGEYDVDDLLVEYVTHELVKNTYDPETNKRVFKKGDEKKIEEATSNYDMYMLIQTMFAMVFGNMQEE